ncbi:hypothetical protein, partial [Burkholderia multivorans]|uniref:hypothetical protein n=1 Tax=Burkholderia multivorans TaxID=87883 RepID=UPI0015EBE1EB
PGEEFRGAEVGQRGDRSGQREDEGSAIGHGLRQSPAQVHCGVEEAAEQLFARCGIEHLCPTSAGLDEDDDLVGETLVSEIGNRATIRADR